MADVSGSSRELKADRLAAIKSVDGSYQLPVTRQARAQVDRPNARVERVRDRLGVVPNAILLDIDEALRLHLSP